MQESPTVFLAAELFFHRFLFPIQCPLAAQEIKNQILQYIKKYMCRGRENCNIKCLLLQQLNLVEGANTSHISATDADTSCNPTAFRI